MPSIPTIIPITIAALPTNILPWIQRRYSRRRTEDYEDDKRNNRQASTTYSRWQSIGAEFGIATLLWAMTLQSSKDDEYRSTITPWWSATTSLVVFVWPQLVPNAPPSIRNGGPLGNGCSKICHVLSGILLWRFIHHTWPNFTLGDVQGGIWIYVGMIVLMSLVNGVMYLWSYLLNSRGDHNGVHTMVEHTQGRSLQLSEHVQIMVLAILNGACEEITSRYFLMMEFQMHLPKGYAWKQTHHGIQYHHGANLAQAIIFGIWHYHGIPSGMTGVALTFVYGGIMGLLFQYTNEGLLLPIVAHSIADYFIFAIIARQQGKTKKR